MGVDIWIVYRCTQKKLSTTIHGLTVTRGIKSLGSGTVRLPPSPSLSSSLSLTFILPPLSSPRPSHPTHKSPGIPQIMSTSRTLATEIVSSTSSELIFKLRQEYKPILFPAAKAVNSLVSLTLVTETEDEKEVERVSYHKDMWNEKDYSHEGLGKVLKTLNGDYLTGVTRPPKSL